MKIIFKIAVVMFIASLLSMVSIVYAQDNGMELDTTSPTMSNLNAVAIVANETETPTLENSNAWAVGDDGTMIEWNGMTWESVMSGTSMHLYGIVMINASLGMAVGGDADNGVVLLYNEGEWSEMETGLEMNATLFGITASSAGPPVYAVGADGTILMWDGLEWTQEMSPTNNTLRSVAMAHDEDEVWAVGDDGTIINYDGEEWTTMDSPTDYNLNSIVMVDASSGWAVGGEMDTGVIINMVGNTWDVWDKINFGGEVDTELGYVADDINATLNSLSVDTAESAWAAGDSGTVLYWGGEDWMGQVDVMDGVNINGIAVIHGADAGDIYAWAVGDEGEIIAWTGTEWVPEFPIIAIPMILGMVALVALIGKFRFNRKIQI